MEEPISRRAEARTSCWDVLNDKGSDALRCGGPRHYVCPAIIVPGLFFGGTTRPHEGTALQTSSESHPVQSHTEAPTRWGWSQDSYVAVRRSGLRPPQAWSTGATSASTRRQQSRNMTTPVPCDLAIGATVFLTPAPSRLPHRRLAQGRPGFSLIVSRHANARDLSWRELCSALHGSRLALVRARHCASFAGVSLYCA